MLIELDKDQVAQHFGRAAQRYDQHAFIQREIGQQLSSQIPSNAHALSLDIGCGTGASLNDLAQVSDNVVAFDLSPDMLRKARAQMRQPDCFAQSNFQWIQGDLDSLPFANNSFDLIHSNLALQWASNLDGVINQIARLLKPKGVLAFSCIVEGTLFELAQAWAAIDKNRHVNRFVDSNSLQKSLCDAGLSGNVYVKQHRWFYPSLALMLKDMKAIGANYVPERESNGLMTPSQWRSLSHSYQQQFGCDAGLPVSYQVLYGVLSRG